MLSQNVQGGRAFSILGNWRRGAWIIFAGVAVMGLAACHRFGSVDEQVEVAKSFAAWRQAMIDRQTDNAMAFIPRGVETYFAKLNASAPEPHSVPPFTPPSTTPGVDLLLRTALEKKVPAEMRPQLTLAALMKRIADKNLFNPREVKQIDLGPISVNGDHATASVYYQGTLTALRLPFVKEDNAWKIDVLGLLPYAEVLMRVDRAWKNETQTQQVDQLVSKLPSL